MDEEKKKTQITISVPPLHREVRRKSGKYNGNNPTVMSYDVLPRASVDSESSLGKPTSPQGGQEAWEPDPSQVDLNDLPKRASDFSWDAEVLYDTDPPPSDSSDQSSAAIMLPPSYDADEPTESVMEDEIEPGLLPNKLKQSSISHSALHSVSYIPEIQEMVNEGTQVSARTLVSQHDISIQMSRDIGDLTLNVNELANLNEKPKSNGGKCAAVEARKRGGATTAELKKLSCGPHVVMDSELPLVREILQDTTAEKEANKQIDQGLLPEFEFDKYPNAYDTSRIIFQPGPATAEVEGTLPPKFTSKFPEYSNLPPCLSYDTMSKPNYNGNLQVLFTVDQIDQLKMLSLCSTKSRTGMTRRRLEVEGSDNDFTPLTIGYRIPSSTPEKRSTSELPYIGAYTNQMSYSVLIQANLDQLLGDTPKSNSNDMDSFLTATEMSTAQYQALDRQLKEKEPSLNHTKCPAKRLDLEHTTTLCKCRSCKDDAEDGKEGKNKEPKTNQGNNNNGNFSSGGGNASGGAKPADTIQNETTNNTNINHDNYKLTQDPILFEMQDLNEPKSRIGFSIDLDRIRAEEEKAQKVVQANFFATKLDKDNVNRFVPKQDITILDRMKELIYLTEKSSNVLPQKKQKGKEKSVEDSWAHIIKQKSVAGISDSDYAAKLSHLIAVTDLNKRSSFVGLQELDAHGDNSSLLLKSNLTIEPITETSVNYFTIDLENTNPIEQDGPGAVATNSVATPDENFNPDIEENSEMEDKTYSVLAEAKKKVEEISKGQIEAGNPTQETSISSSSKVTPIREVTIPSEVLWLKMENDIDALSEAPSRTESQATGHTIPNLMPGAKAESIKGKDNTSESKVKLEPKVWKLLNKKLSGLSLDLYPNYETYDWQRMHVTKSSVTEYTQASETASPGTKNPTTRKPTLLESAFKRITNLTKQTNFVNPTKLRPTENTSSTDEEKSSEEKSQVDRIIEATQHNIKERLPEITKARTLPKTLDSIQTNGSNCIDPNNVAPDLEGEAHAVDLDTDPKESVGKGKELFDKIYRKLTPFFGSKHNIAPQRAHHYIYNAVVQTGQNYLRGAYAGNKDESGNESAHSENESMHSESGDPEKENRDSFNCNENKDIEKNPSPQNRVSFHCDENKDIEKNASPQNRDSFHSDENQDIEKNASPQNSDSFQRNANKYIEKNASQRIEGTSDESIPINPGEIPITELSTKSVKQQTEKSVGMIYTDTQTAFTVPGTLQNLSTRTTDQQTDKHLILPLAGVSLETQTYLPPKKKLRLSEMEEKRIFLPRKESRFGTKSEQQQTGVADDDEDAVKPKLGLWSPKAPMHTADFSTKSTIQQTEEAPDLTGVITELPVDEPERPKTTIQKTIKLQTSDSRNVGDKKLETSSAVPLTRLSPNKRYRTVQTYINLEVLGVLAETQTEVEHEKLISHDTQSSKADMFDDVEFAIQTGQSINIIPKITEEYEEDIPSKALGPIEGMEAETQTEVDVVPTPVKIMSDEKVAEPMQIEEVALKAVEQSTSVPVNLQFGEIQVAHITQTGKSIDIPGENVAQFISKLSKDGHVQPLAPAEDDLSKDQIKSISPPAGQPSSIPEDKPQRVSCDETTWPDSRKAEQLPSVPEEPCKAKCAEQTKPVSPTAVLAEDPTEIPKDDPYKDKLKPDSQTADQPPQVPDADPCKNKIKSVQRSSASSEDGPCKEKTKPSSKKDASGKRRSFLPFGRKKQTKEDTACDCSDESLVSTADITATPAIEDSPATDPGPGSRWASIPDSLTTDTGPGSRWASVDTHQIIPPIPGCFYTENMSRLTAPENAPIVPQRDSEAETIPDSRWASIDTQQIKPPIPGCFDSKRISETVPVNDSAPTEWTGQDIRRLSDTDQIQPPIPGWIETEKVSPTLSENDPNSKTETGPGSRWASIDTNQVQLPIPGCYTSDKFPPTVPEDEINKKRHDTTDDRTSQSRSIDTNNLGLPSQAAKHSANPDLLSKDSAQLVPQSAEQPSAVPKGYSCQDKIKPVPKDNSCQDKIRPVPQDNSCKDKIKPVPKDNSCRDNVKSLPIDTSCKDKNPVSKDFQENGAAIPGNEPNPDTARGSIDTNRILNSTISFLNANALCYKQEPIKEELEPEDNPTIETANIPKQPTDTSGPGKTIPVYGNWIGKECTCVRKGKRQESFHKTEPIKEEEEPENDVSPADANNMLGTAEKKSLTVENKQIEKELKKLAELDSRWVSIDPNQISFSIADTPQKASMIESNKNKLDARNLRWIPIDTNQILFQMPDTPGKLPPTISKLEPIKDEQIPSKNNEYEPTNSTDPRNEPIEDKFIPELISSIISEALTAKNSKLAINEEEPMQDASRPPTFEMQPIRSAPISPAIPEEESLRDRFFFGNIATPIPPTIPENPIEDATINEEKRIEDENAIKADLMGMFYPTQDFSEQKSSTVSDKKNIYEEPIPETGLDLLDMLYSPQGQSKKRPSPILEEGPMDEMEDDLKIDSAEERTTIMPDIELKKEETSHDPELIKEELRPEFGFVEEDFAELSKLKQKLKDLPKYVPYAKPVGSQVALIDSNEEPTYPIEEPRTKERFIPEITAVQNPAPVENAEMDQNRLDEPVESERVIMTNEPKDLPKPIKDCAQNFKISIATQSQARLTQLNTCQTGKSLEYLAQDADDKPEETDFEVPKHSSAKKNSLKIVPKELTTIETKSASKSKSSHIGKSMEMAYINLDQKPSPEEKMRSKISEKINCKELLTKSGESKTNNIEPVPSTKSKPKCCAAKKSSSEKPVNIVKEHKEQRETKQKTKNPETSDKPVGSQTYQANHAIVAKQKKPMFARYQFAPKIDFPTQMYARSLELMRESGFTRTLKLGLTEDKEKSFRKLLDYYPSIIVPNLSLKAKHDPKNDTESRKKPETPKKDSEALKNGSKHKQQEVPKKDQKELQNVTIGSRPEKPEIPKKEPEKLKNDIIGLKGKCCKAKESYPFNRDLDGREKGPKETNMAVKAPKQFDTLKTEAGDVKDKAELSKNERIKDKKEPTELIKETNRPRSKCCKAKESYQSTHYLENNENGLAETRLIITVKDPMMGTEASKKGEATGAGEPKKERKELKFKPEELISEVKKQTKDTEGLKNETRTKSNCCRAKSTSYLNEKNKGVKELPSNKEPKIESEQAKKAEAAKTDRGPKKEAKEQQKDVDEQRKDTRQPRSKCCRAKENCHADEKAKITKVRPTTNIRVTEWKVEIEISQKDADEPPKEADKPTKDIKEPAGKGAKESKDSEKAGEGSRKNANESGKDAEKPGKDAGESGKDQDKPDKNAGAPKKDPEETKKDDEKSKKEAEEADKKAKSQKEENDEKKKESKHICKAVSNMGHQSACATGCASKQPMEKSRKEPPQTSIIKREPKEPEPEPEELEKEIDQLLDDVELPKKIDQKANKCCAMGSKKK